MRMDCYPLAARTRLIEAVQFSDLRGFSTIYTANRRMWFVFTIYLYLNCRRAVSGRGGDMLSDIFNHCVGAVAAEDIFVAVFHADKKTV